MSDETERFRRGREGRIAELATGFALGELDEEELHRFYDLLREPGPAGAEAARVAWQVLGTTVDLRASLGTRLQDTVRHRIDRGDEGPRNSFVGGVMARLGFERATLGKVRIPVPQSRYRFPWLIALLGITLGVGAAIWSGLEDEIEPLAVVTAVHGAVTREGSFVVDRQVVDQRPIVLGQVAGLTLRWDRGEAGHAEVRVVGPARIVPQVDGLSLLEGRAAVSTLTPFRLGLPDRHAEVAAHSELVAEVFDDRSQLGVESGLVVIGSPGAEAEGHELRAGEAIAGGGTPFRWIASRELTGEGAERHLASDPTAPSWDIAFTVTFNQQDDAIELATEDGVTTVRFRPGSVEITSWNGDTDAEIAIPGPPLRRWRAHLRARPGFGAELRIDEADIVHPLPDRRLPTVMRFTGEAGISALQHHTGPEPLR